MQKYFKYHGPCCKFSGIFSYVEIGNILVKLAYFTKLNREECLIL